MSKNRFVSIVTFNNKLIAIDSWGDVWIGTDHCGEDRYISWERQHTPAGFDDKDDQFTAERAKLEEHKKKALEYFKKNPA